LIIIIGFSSEKHWKLGIDENSRNATLRCEGLMARKSTKEIGNFGQFRSFFISLLLSILPISSCYVAEYEKPISDFSTATADAEESLIGLNKQVTTAYTELQSKRVVAGQVQPRFFTGDRSGLQDCLVISSRCRLELLDSGANSLGAFPQNAALRNMIILMTSIRMYAQNLTNIVNADTSAKVSANVNSTLGSVASLAGSVEKVGGQVPGIDLEEYKTPVGEAINWLVGNYIAAVQLDGLRRATAAADPVIAEAARVIEPIIGAGADVPKAALAEAVSMRNDAFAEERTAANLKLLITDAAAYDQFLLAKPGGVFARMKDAHHALANNLQGEDPSLGQVAKKIKYFLIEAETLRRIIESLLSAGKEKEK
jgi:hypothetical protein